jgi:hypothetical protein
MFVKAAIALDAKKAMLKQAALEVVFELANLNISIRLAATRFLLRWAWQCWT